MYANQAKQYTGESSLDHEENNDEERPTYTEDSTDKMEDSNENTMNNHVIDEGLKLIQIHLIMMTMMSSINMKKLI